MKRITIEYLNEKGFQENDALAWPKYRKNGFELVKIPLKNGGYVIGFEYQFCSQAKYKYPITESELNYLYKFLTGEEL